MQIEIRFNFLDHFISEDSSSVESGVSGGGSGGQGENSKRKTVQFRESGRRRGHGGGAGNGKATPHDHVRSPVFVQRSRNPGSSGRIQNADVIISVKDFQAQWITFE